MTEVVEVETIQKKKYIAIDGKEFDDKFSCQEWENGIRLKSVIDRLCALPHFSHTPEFVDSDHAWEWYLVSSEEDLDLVTEYYEISGEPCPIDIEQESYPQWIAVSSCDFDRCSQIEGTKDDIIRRIREFENDLIKAIKDKEKAT